MKPIDGKNPRAQESMTRRLLMVAAAVLPVAIFAVGTWYIGQHRDLPERVVIATGSAGGTYLPLGSGIAEVVLRELEPVDARAVETSGSTENVELVASRQAHFGFVQNDAPGDANLRTVARLYQEVLQIVIAPGVEGPGIATLAGARVELGAENSGTHELAAGVLRHFGLREGDYRAFHRSTPDAVEAFRAGEVDAVAVLAGLRTAAVEELLAVSGARLVSLGDPQATGSSLEGLVFDLPGTRPTAIPARTYGDQPERAVGTIAVEALLVTHRNTSDLLVQQVTGAIFANRFQLSEIHPAASQMVEIQDAKGLRFPLHPGAASYYARNEPPFFVVYAEALSFAITLALTLGSGFLALREWINRTKKNRIDRFYMALEEASSRLGEPLDREELAELRRELVVLRRRAFRDLVAERLRADESFAIFQDALHHRLAEIAASFPSREPAEDRPPRRARL